MFESIKKKQLTLASPVDSPCHRYARHPSLRCAERGKDVSSTQNLEPIITDKNNNGENLLGSSPLNIINNL